MSKFLDQLTSFLNAAKGFITAIVALLGAIILLVNTCKPQVPTSPPTPASTLGTAMIPTPASAISKVTYRDSIVYIQYTNSAKTEILMEQLRSRLRTLGVSTPPIQGTDEEYTNEVRYFYDDNEEGKRAEEVANIIQVFLTENGNTSKVTPRYFEAYEAKRGQLEVYITLNKP